MAETSNETSYDVLEWFPILVCQNIFQYLDGKDVIQASAVNKEWYKLCAESQQAKKLKLVLCNAQNEGLTDKDKELLQNSKRKYQHIDLNSIAVSRILSLFHARRGSWKSVNLSGYLIKREVSELFRIIEPSVEELVISHIGHEEPGDGDPSWTFPCLQVLKGCGRLGKLWRTFFNCTSFVKLHWTFCDVESIEVVSELLRINSNLKDLTINAAGPLLKHPTEFKFKLDQLLINGFVSGRHYDLVALHAFLETQAQTLKSLAINVILNRACLELILSMPKLSSFITVSAEHTIHLANTTITSLEFTYVMCSQNREAFESLIRSLTSLKHFKCNGIENYEFVFLAREVPALESFAADYLYVTRFPEGDIFPNLKEFKMGDFIYYPQEPTGDSNFAKLARKAMRESFAVD